MNFRGTILLGIPLLFGSSVYAQDFQKKCDTSRPGVDWVEFEIFEFRFGAVHVFGYDGKT